jgi:hypothetical protein
MIEVMPAPFPTARNSGTMVYGKDKCGTKEKARACADWQGHSDRRAMAPRRACGDRCLDRVVERQKAHSGTRHKAIGSARADGENEVKGWKWVGDLRVQVCIIATLLFVIWVALQQQYLNLLRTDGHL